MRKFFVFIVVVFVIISDGVGSDVVDSVGGLECGFGEDIKILLYVFLVWDGIFGGVVDCFNLVFFFDGDCGGVGSDDLGVLSLESDGSLLLLELLLLWLFLFDDKNLIGIE